MLSPSIILYKTKAYSEYRPYPCVSNGYIRSFVQGDWCDEAGWFECEHGTLNLIENSPDRVTYDKPGNSV